MRWISVKDRWPETGQAILFFDSKNRTIDMAHVNSDDLIVSDSAYCNRSCGWTYDDCSCDLLVSEDDYWMPLPKEPNENKKPQVFPDTWKISTYKGEG